MTFLKGRSMGIMRLGVWLIGGGEGGGVTEVGGWKRNEGRNAGYKYEGAQ